MMPDELHGYDFRPRDELVRLLRQRDGEIDDWRERWREEQQRRLEAERGNIRCSEDV